MGKYILLLKLLVSLILTLFSLNSFSQSVNIIGRLTDNQTKYPIAGAVVSVEQSKAVTDTLGIFKMIVDESLLRTNGELRATCLGYEDYAVKLSPADTATFFHISMKNMEHALKDVIVYSQNYSENIIKEALKRVPDNYVYKPFNMQFYQDTYEKNDFGLDFRNNAVTELFFNPRNRSSVPALKVIQNKQVFNQIDSIPKGYSNSYHKNWFRSYTLAKFSLLPYSKSTFLNKNIEKYDYLGIIDYRDMKVHVIDIYNKKDSFTKTSLFIDTASKAFVTILTKTTTAKINKIGLLKLATIKLPLFTYDIRVNFDFINNKWMFSSANSSLSSFTKQSDGRITESNNKDELRFLSIDTLNPRSFEYDVRANELKIHNNILDNNPQIWKNVEDKLSIKTIPDSIALKLTDTINNTNVTIEDYISDELSISNWVNRVGFSLSVGRSPFTLNTSQPAWGNPLSAISNYNFGYGLHSKLYKKSDINYFSHWKYYPQQLRIKNNIFSISTNYYVNPAKSFYLTPQVGYNKIKIKKAKEVLYISNNVLAGISLNQRIGRNRTLSLGANYTYPLSEKNLKDIYIENNKFSFSLSMKFGF